MSRFQSFRLIVVAALVPSGLCPAQEAQPTARPQSQPANATTDQPASLSATVVEVTGDVTRAPVGTSPLDAAAWQAVEPDDEFSAGTLIRTGIRSHLTLRFGDDTIIHVRRLTLASIDAFYRTETTQTTRLGLGYGAIRGGSTEGTLRSDLVIDSTVATLAKRGTEGFEMEVEPYTGRFTISLAREGLVEALRKATGERRLVRPGQYANHENIAAMWVKQNQFDRQVHFVAADALSAEDRRFNAQSERGFAAVAPGGGSELRSFQPRQDQRPLANQLLPERDRVLESLQSLSLPDLALIERPFVRRPEGNFGLGQSIRILVPEDRARRYRPGSFRGTPATRRR